jgi:hypothetical protein
VGYVMPKRTTKNFVIRSLLRAFSTKATCVWFDASAELTAGLALGKYIAESNHESKLALSKVV